jgi:hypothetical protein
LLIRGTLALIPLDVNQTAQELREKDMSYFKGAVTSKTLKDVLEWKTAPLKCNTLYNPSISPQIYIFQANITGTSN